MVLVQDVRNAVRRHVSMASFHRLEDLDLFGALPGTTSLASMASLYSMNPKPFMSLISVISPVPWVEK